MIAVFYRAATTLGGPLVKALLRRRLARGKEDPVRFAERLGEPGRPRPPGRLLWIHGASVGEALAALPLIDRVLSDRPGWSVLVSTGTVTSARLLGERLPPGAFHQYVPVDRLPWVRRFLAHWRPDAAIWLESELWPNLILETRAAGIPLALVNGRMSAASARGWRKARGLARRLLSGFAPCLVQTSADADRLIALGAPQAEAVGNLKGAAPPLPADPAALAALETAVGGRPCWLAASTHAGDEALAWAAHRATALAGLLTVIVPRHPERGPAIAAELAAAGARVALRSAGALPTAETEVYIADTLGELGLFYRLCPVALMGKSVVSSGGQNPLEPARLGCAVLFGPHMEAFADLAARMVAAHGAQVVASAEAVAAAVAALLREPGTRAALAENAEAFAAAEAAVLERVWRRLAPLLPASPPAPGAPPHAGP